MVEAITCNISEELGRKVLHVFDHSFPIGDGYAYRSGEVIHFERRLGWKTIHLTSAKQGATQSAVESIDGLEFHRTQPSRYRLHSIPAMNQWGVVTTLGKRIAEIAGRKRPDILHVHSPCLNGIAALGVGRRMNLPIVYEMRSSWEDAAVDSGTCREGDLRYRLSRVLESYVCRKVNHVVTICDGLREDIISRGIAGNRVTVVPNSVDLARFMRIGIRDEVEATRLRLERDEGTSNEVWAEVGHHSDTVRELYALTERGAALVVAEEEVDTVRAVRSSHSEHPRLKELALACTGGTTDQTVRGQFEFEHAARNRDL